VGGIVSACGDSSNADATPPAPFSVKVIGFNDYHGNLASPGTFGINLSGPPRAAPSS
jgi:5'-nucleotidase